MLPNIQILPIIHSAAFQITVGQWKTERANEMQARICAGTQTPDVARVLRNLRTKKNDVNHLKCCRKYTELALLLVLIPKKPYAIYPISNTLVRLDASDTGTRMQHKDAQHHESTTKPAASRFFERIKNWHKLLETLPNGTFRIPLFRAFL